jgi:hypothetical protein
MILFFASNLYQACNDMAEVYVLYKGGKKGVLRSERIKKIYFTRLHVVLPNLLNEFIWSRVSPVTRQITCGFWI